MLGTLIRRTFGAVPAEQPPSRQSMIEHYGLDKPGATPVSDSLEGLGEQMIDTARFIRSYEPMSIDVMRDVGIPLMRAGMDEMECLSRLMQRLGGER